MLKYTTIFECYKFLIMINVRWWQYSGKQDDYVDLDEDVDADNEDEAIAIIKKKYPRSKSFKTTILNEHDSASR